MLDSQQKTRRIFLTSHQTTSDECHSNLPARIINGQHKPSLFLRNRPNANSYLPNRTSTNIPCLKLAHAATAANATFAVQFLCGDEWQKKWSAVIKVEERSAGNIWKEQRKQIERRTYKKPWGGRYSSLQSSFDVCLEGGNESGKMGESEKAGNRERVKWRD